MRDETESTTNMHILAPSRIVWNIHYKISNAVESQNNFYNEQRECLNYEPACLMCYQVHAMHPAVKICQKLIDSVCCS